LRGGFPQSISTSHKSGPIDGTACHLGLLGASDNPIALDTAIYKLLGLEPHIVPLWNAVIEKKMTGSNPNHIHYLIDQPSSFKSSHFIIPSPLKPLSFHPLRLIKSRIKNILARF
jgi:uncharacterized protein (DUF362 family)